MSTDDGTNTDEQGQGHEGRNPIHDRADFRDIDIESEWLTGNFIGFTEGRGNVYTTHTRLVPVGDAILIPLEDCIPFEDWH